MNAINILDPSPAIVRRLKDRVTALDNPKDFESFANDGKGDFRRDQGDSYRAPCK